MEYHVEKGEGGACRLTCFFSAADVTAEWKKAAAPFASSFRMAGFRPGRAPLEVLERQFGRQIAEETTDALVGRGVKKALSAEGLLPVTAFTYEGENALRGRDFRFSVSFGVLPDAETPDFSSLRIEGRIPAADAGQDAAALRDMLGRMAERVPVKEGRPQDGDIVQADVTGRIDGRVVPGMNTGPCRMRLMPLMPGEKAPDLAPVIRSLSIGETGTGTTVCPDNYPDPSLRGRDIELTVTLRSVEREILPPLTEETARRLGFSGVEALENAAHELALERSGARLHMEAKRELMERLEAWEGVEAPSCLVEHCRREAMRRSRQYLQSSYESPDKLREILALMKEEAEETARKKAVRRMLLLGWARGEGLEVRDAELERVLAGRAAAQNMDAASYARSLARGGDIYEMRAAMLEERALEALLARVLRP